MSSEAFLVFISFASPTERYKRSRKCAMSSGKISLRLNSTANSTPKSKIPVSRSANRSFNKLKTPQRHRDQNMSAEGCVGGDKPAQNEKESFAKLQRSEERRV